MLSWIGIGQAAEDANQDAAAGAGATPNREGIDYAMLDELEVMQAGMAATGTRSFDPQAFMRECLAFHAQHRAEWFSGNGLVLTEGRRPPRFKMYLVEKAFEAADDYARAKHADAHKVLQAAHLFQAAILRAAAHMAPFALGRPVIHWTGLGRGPGDDNVTNYGYRISFEVPAAAALPAWAKQARSLALAGDVHVYAGWPYFRTALAAAWQDSWRAAVKDGLQKEFAQAYCRVHGFPELDPKNAKSDADIPWGDELADDDGKSGHYTDALRLLTAFQHEVLCKKVGAQSDIGYAASAPLALFTDLRMVSSAAAEVCNRVDREVLSMAMSHNRVGFRYSVYGNFLNPSVKESISSSRAQHKGAMAVFAYNDAALLAITGRAAEGDAQKVASDCAGHRAWLRELRVHLGADAVALLEQTSPRYLGECLWLHVGRAVPATAAEHGSAFAHVLNAHLAQLKRLGLRPELPSPNLLSSYVFFDAIETGSGAADVASSLGCLTAAVAILRRRGSTWNPFRENRDGEPLLLKMARNKAGAALDVADVLKAKSPESIVAAVDAARVHPSFPSSHARLLGNALMKHAEAPVAAGKKVKAAAAANSAAVFRTTAPSNVASVPDSLAWELARVRFRTGTRCPDGVRLERGRDNLVQLTFRDPKVPAAWMTLEYRVVASKDRSNDEVLARLGLSASVMCEALQLSESGDIRVYIDDVSIQRVGEDAPTAEQIQALRPLDPSVPHSSSSPEDAGVAFSPAGAAMAAAEFVKTRAQDRSLAQVAKHGEQLQARVREALTAAIRENPVFLLTALSGCIANSRVAAPESVGERVKPLSAELTSQLLRGMTGEHFDNAYTHAGRLLAAKVRNPLWRSPSGRTLLDVAIDSSKDNPLLVQGFLEGLRLNPALQSADGSKLNRALVQSSMTRIVERCPGAIPAAVAAGGELDAVSLAAWEALLPMRRNDYIDASVRKSQMRQVIEAARAKAAEGEPQVVNAPAPGRRRRPGL